ncbi:MAG: hypothetical protein M0R22_10555, partial [Dehalococcoidia bacterium]|nr:hypothetical protein [Dehalococcoidia bacterium]
MNRICTEFHECNYTTSYCGTEPVDGACWNSSCVNNTECVYMTSCTGATPVCMDTVCVGCMTPEDCVTLACHSPVQCLNMTCYDPGLKVDCFPCVDDLDCPYYRPHCYEQECVACINASDCGPRLPCCSQPQCNDHHCAVSCQPDCVACINASSCPYVPCRLATCPPETYECAYGPDCPAPPDGCSTQVCQANHSCVYQTACGGSTPVCSAGLCVGCIVPSDCPPTACRELPGCASGGGVVDGVVFTSPGVCVDGLIKPGCVVCTTEADCPDIECTTKSCVTPGECNYTLDCTPPANNSCETLTCMPDHSCVYETTCTGSTPICCGGNCTECCTAADCDDWACYTSTCSGNVCGHNPDCAPPTPESCTTLSCAGNHTCQYNTTCTPGTVCNAGTCVGCVTTADCPTDRVCVGQQCVECAVAADCPHLPCTTTACEA